VDYKLKHIAADQTHFNECQLTKQISRVLSSEDSLNVDICDVKIDISNNGTSKNFNLAGVSIIIVKSKTDEDSF